ncbi:hypothetical protein [Sphingobium boeckii]|uniref:Uncharacterized protein n=1 Tax=Sphingobium boeckii TaxID=1082345 RepID=A0A7W9AI73_9SPHN|nr:hypothetical protein [Sphingobium boeckii]MBB5686155.1 hypothetical protein [Sphingobium boeckii]
MVNRGTFAVCGYVLDTEDIWFSDTGRRTPYAALTGQAKARADRLVTE